MLRIFADERRLPALIHCAHGKDRTGVVIMLLMQLAGLTPDEVVGDYVQSEAELKKYRWEAAGGFTRVGAGRLVCCGPAGRCAGEPVSTWWAAVPGTAGQTIPPPRRRAAPPACRSQLPVDALTRAVIPLDDVIVASTEETMRRVLAWLEHKYGRVEDYLASTGGWAWRAAAGLGCCACWADGAAAVPVCPQLAAAGAARGGVGSFQARSGCRKSVAAQMQLPHSFWLSPVAPVAGLSPEEVEAIRRNITARQEAQEGAGRASSVL